MSDPIPDPTPDPTPEVRASLAKLIAWVRLLIDEPTEDNLTDLTLQNLLDHNRSETIDDVMTPRYIHQPGGNFLINIFNAPDDNTYWDDDTVLLDRTYTPITPTHSDPINGRWDFSDTDTYPLGVVTPIFIRGRHYDVDAVVVKCCKILLAMLKGKFRYISPNRANFSLTDKRDNLIALIAQYSSAEGLSYIPAYRTDENPITGWDF
jgi:hypothetical protein